MISTKLLGATHFFNASLEMLARERLAAAR